MNWDSFDLLLRHLDLLWWFLTALIFAEINICLSVAFPSNIDLLPDFSVSYQRNREGQLYVAGSRPMLTPNSKRPKDEEETGPRADLSRRGVIDDTEDRLAKQNCICHFLVLPAPVQTTVWGIWGICTHVVDVN